jgi:Na+-driven multidrug efflux pump
MKDLTKGSITSHILSMAPPIFGGMILIMVCQLIDLYFVSDLGDAAIAGVAAAGNAGFLVNALMQVLGVGSVALIAHAVGRKDRADANLVFNQSLALAGACAFATWIFGSALARTYMASVSADKAIHRSRHDLFALLHTGVGNAVRVGGDGLRSARHGYRSAHDARPGTRSDA